MNTDNAPKGMLTLRVPAMPKDANAAFDIFGGWVMAQMESASAFAPPSVRKAAW
jgi:acyl-CoA thioesterase YciA